MRGEQKSTTHDFTNNKRDYEPVSAWDYVGLVIMGIVAVAILAAYVVVF